MNTDKVFVLLALSASVALLGGCRNESAAKPPDCAAYNTITDAAQKAELAKRCPGVGGPVFKPSPEKKW